MTQINILKDQMLRYLQGLICICGKPKDSKHWECIDCRKDISLKVFKDDLRKKCTAHTLAAQRYVEALKQSKVGLGGGEGK
jgi:hypothetical protein